MGVFEEFDYAGMAEECLKRVHRLEAGLEEVRASPARGLNEKARRNSRINLLEEEIMEQRALYKFFCRRAKERGQPR